MNVSVAQRYRMYIDESGNHHYASETSTNEYDPNQYLGLIGIIVENQHTIDFIQPQFKTMKNIFKDPDDPDKSVILHYNDVVLKKGVFEILGNSQIENQFNTLWLNFLTKAKFVICSVVLDKNTHKARYKEPMHPYHYCLNILLQQYLSFLKSHHFVGDVKAETRGDSEDKDLREEFSHFFQKSQSDKIQEYFTSKEIKFSTKNNMVCGIELADMLVSPLKKYILQQYKEHLDIINTDTFDYQVLQKVKSKIEDYRFIK